MDITLTGMQFNRKRSVSVHFEKAAFNLYAKDHLIRTIHSRYHPQRKPDWLTKLTKPLSI